MVTAIRANDSAGSSMTMLEEREPCLTTGRRESGWEGSLPKLYKKLMDKCIKKNLQQEVRRV
jgi:hypothetical protein